MFFFSSIFISYRVKGWMGAQKGHKVTSYDLFSDEKDFKYSMNHK